MRFHLIRVSRVGRAEDYSGPVVEYFLVVARTETSNAEAYSRTARMARVSGSRNTEPIRIAAVVTEMAAMHKRMSMMMMQGGMMQMPNGAAPIR